MPQPQRYVYIQNNRVTKFWEIWNPYSWGGKYEVRVRYGAHGTVGKLHIHTEDSLQDALIYKNQKITEKKNKGYTLDQIVGNAMDRLILSLVRIINNCGECGYRNDYEEEALEDARKHLKQKGIIP